MSLESAELARSELEARILVVDDEPDVAELVADALRQADPSWEVVTETDPEQALARMADEAFDCVVTDLVMPKMDGLALAKRIRSGDEEVAMIAISGRGTLESGIEALRMGFADFLEKPFDLEDIQRSVCRTLRRRRNRSAVDQRLAELAQAKAQLETDQAQLSQKLEIASHDLVLSSKRMARQLEEVAQSANVAKALMGIVELEDLLGLCAELVGDSVPCKTSSLALYEAQEAAVGLLVRAHPDADDPPVLCWLRSPIRTGVMCRAAESRKAIHIDETRNSVIIDPQERDLWSEGRLLAVPILYQDLAVGVAMLHRGPAEADFAPDDIKRVLSLVKVMGASILAAKVHHRQRCQIYSTLERVADGVEQRQSWLVGHGARVQAYAQTVAEALRLDQSEIGALQIAARLHDIGYASTPQPVTDHAGPLTEEQWEIVRRHPAAGQALLEPLDFFGQVGEIIRAHHESFDGTGYPDNKAGGEIPMVARVISLADAFDAMTSLRPHRQAMSISEAADKVRSLAGQQFDPQVVETFLAIPETVLAEIHASHR